MIVNSEFKELVDGEIVYVTECDSDCITLRIGNKTVSIYPNAFDPYSGSELTMEIESGD